MPTRTRKTPWIELGDLEDVERALPDLLQKPERWKSMAYPFGNCFSIERITCDLATGECVMLSRFTQSTAKDTFITPEKREPAFVERVLEGTFEVGIPRRLLRRSRRCLHAAAFALTPGSALSVRNGNRLSWRLGTEIVLTVMVTRDPIILDTDKMPAQNFLDLLEQCQGHYPISRA